MSDTKIIDWVRLVFNNHKIIIAIITAIFGIGVSGYSYMTYEPEPELSISVAPEAKDIKAPPKQYTELVIPTHSKHECKLLIDEAMKKHLASDDH